MPEQEYIRPKVGVGVMIFKDGKILLGQRKNVHGAGEYAFPGGHVEHLESFADCANREIAEECGIKVKNIRFQLLANVTKYAPKHYAHIGLMADWESGEPRVLEPEKQGNWAWFGLSELPAPLFETARLQIEAIKTGKIFFDSK